MGDDRPSAALEWEEFQASLAASLAAIDRGLVRIADPMREEWMRGWMAEGFSPEEWVARHAQDLLAFSGGEFSYSQPALNDWVHRLDAILFMPGATDICRRHLLTADEMRADLDREAEPS